MIKKGPLPSAAKVQINRNKTSIIFPFFLGIFLGLIAKFVDVPEFTYKYPIFDDLMVRFGIWVFTAALIAIVSKSPLYAAARSFVFFAGMLSAYYVYTVLFLNFFPKSQIILWSCISMITPVCGFVLWHLHENKWYAGFLGSLPFVIFFSEWYLTGKDNSLLAAYLCMAFLLLLAYPTNRKRFFSLCYGLSASALLICLIQNDIIINFYDRLLNI